MKLEAMTEADLDEAQALTTSFNWPHTVEDWSFAFGLGEGHVAREGRRLLGTCLTWRLASGVSTLGLLAVAEEAQGQGLGRALLRRALDDQKEQTVLLHATHQAIDLYQTEGFEPIGKVRQLQGIVRSLPSKFAPSVSICDPSQTSVNLERLQALDHEATGVERRALLEALRPLARLAWLGPEDNPSGFAFIRRFGRGQVIGPVIAQSEADACALVCALLDTQVDRFVRIDVTENLSGLDWLTACGLSEVDQVLAMSNGPMPEATGPAMRYGLVGHAFG